MKTQHTPTPWSVFRGDRAVVGERSEQYEANTAFIVRAVNSFDSHIALIKTLTLKLRQSAAGMTPHDLSYWITEAEEETSKGEK